LTSAFIFLLFLLARSRDFSWFEQQEFVGQNKIANDKNTFVP